MAGSRSASSTVSRQSSWSAAVTAGELPTPAGTFCQFQGNSCNIWDSNSDHGVEVAEVIHDQAPAASLYIAFAATTEDLQAAVNYFASQGVRIISRSLSALFDGAGDGSGPVGTVVDNAVAAGITWFNSAGNSAGTPPTPPGSYWRGSWLDADNDNFLEWAPGDEVLEMRCGFVLGLRWNDWGLDRTDYDIRIYDDPGQLILKGMGEDDQPGGAPPLEHPNPSSCGGPSDFDYVVVELFDAGGGTADDTLEFMTNGTGLSTRRTRTAQGSLPRIATTPARFRSGRSIRRSGATIGWYSSQGPTNDGRFKPDLSAAACVKSFIGSPACFNGTSAATPVTSGAAAVVLGAFPSFTPAQLKSYLLTQATVARGAPGVDNVYGYGELSLPAPPASGSSGGSPGGAGASGGASGGAAGSGGSSKKGQVCNTNIGLSKAARKVRGGAIKLNFSLPRKTYCRVTVSVWGSGKKGKLLGQTTALLSGANGASLTLKLRINSTGRRKLKRSRRIKAEVFVQAGTGSNRNATAFMSKRIVLKR